LFGLINVSDGRAAAILREAEIDNERYLYYFQKSVDRTLMIPGNMFTPRTKKVLERAIDFSLQARTGYVGTEHLLLALLMQYDGFAVGVEGTWDLPQSYPFTATFRVTLEKAVIENAGGNFLMYDENGAHKIEIEKKFTAQNAYKGGNISDLGGYYNELLYFCDKASRGEKIELATLSDSVSSLEFLLKELSFNS
jgi:hypothetical protein